MNWRESLFSLLLLAIALFLWQLLNKQEPDLATDNTGEQILPGYYLNNAELTRFNTNGTPQYTITAEKIEQDPNSNILTLTDINIEYHEKSQWLITADKAHLPGNREIINFSGNVIATQNSSNENINFTSDTLNYDIERQLLTTQDSIQARKGSQLISAKGMLLDMQNEQVQLLSQVKIRFLP